MLSVSSDVYDLAPFISLSGAQAQDGIEFQGSQHRLRASLLKARGKREVCKVVTLSGVIPSHLDSFTITAYRRLYEVALSRNCSPETYDLGGQPSERHASRSLQSTRYPSCLPNLYISRADFPDQKVLDQKSYSNQDRV